MYNIDNNTTINEDLFEDFSDEAIGQQIDAIISGQSDIDRPKQETDWEALGITCPDTRTTDVREADWSDDYMASILGYSVSNPEFFATAKEWLRPGYFRLDAHRVILKELHNYLKEHKRHPSELEFIEVVKLKQRDRNHTHYTDALEHALSLDRRATSEEVMERLSRFAETQEFRVALLEAHSLIMPSSMDNSKERLKQFLSMDFSPISKELKLLSFGDENFLEGENLDWIVDDLLPAGSLMMFAGSPKAGKSIFMLWMIKQILYGGEVLGSKTHGEKNVIYVDYENGRKYVYDWYKTFMGKDDPRIWNERVQYASAYAHPSGNGTLPNYLDLGWLKRAIAGKEAGVIIIDTLRGAYGNRPDLAPNWENSASEVGKLLRPLGTFAKESGWAVIVLHHLNNADKVSGSTDIRGACDLVCTFERNIAQASNECKITTMGRLPAPIPKRVVFFNGSDFTYRGVYSEVAEERKEMRVNAQRQQVLSNTMDAIIKTLEDNDKLNWEDIMNATGIYKNKVVEVLHILVENGAVDRFKEGKKVLYSLKRE